MTDLGKRLAEDRLLRDAALVLVKADIDHVTRSLTSDGARPGMGTQAQDLAEDARDFASQHRLGLGALVAAIVAGVLAWKFRGTLAVAFGRMLARQDGPQDDDAQHDTVRQDDGTDPEHNPDNERSENEPEIPAETQA